MQRLFGWATTPPGPTTLEINATRPSYGRLLDNPEQDRENIKHMTANAIRTAHYTALAATQGRQTLASWIQEYTYLHAKDLAKQGIAASSATWVRHGGRAAAWGLGFVPFLAIPVPTIVGAVAGMAVQSRAGNAAGAGIQKGLTAAINKIPGNTAARVLFEAVIVVSKTTSYVPNVFKLAVDCLLREVIYHYAGYKIDVKYISAASLKHEAAIRELIRGHDVPIDELVKLTNSVIDGLDAAALKAIRTELYAKYQLVMHGATKPEQYAKSRFVHHNVASYPLKSVRPMTWLDVINQVPR